MALAAPELTRDVYLDRLAKTIPEGAPEAPLNAWQAEIARRAQADMEAGGGLENHYDVVRALSPDHLLDGHAVLLGSAPESLRPFDRILDVVNPFLGELEKSNVDRRVFLPGWCLVLEGFPTNTDPDLLKHGTASRPMP
jgi:hypothetical protein